MNHRQSAMKLQLISNPDTKRERGENMIKLVKPNNLVESITSRVWTSRHRLPIGDA